jgi:hypothetical protein
MGVQPDLVAIGKIARHFEQFGRASLRAIDTEHDTHKIVVAGLGGDLLHHGEIVFRRRRARACPAGQHIGRQAALIDG